MEPFMQGTCNCGGITVLLNIPNEPPKLSLCHCNDCRASGGSLFAVNLLVPASNMNIGGTETLKVYSSKAASGNTSNRYFCPTCGSPIYTSVPEKPDIVFIKGGLFRAGNYELPVPAKEQWWRRAEAWEHPYAPRETILQ